jgi:hypothetical protein
MGGGLMINNVEDFYQAVREERSKLRAFAQEIMDHWPEGGIDGDDLQEAAVKHRLLKPTIKYEPCGNGCFCSGYANSREFKNGVTCFVKTELLNGDIK